MIGRWMHALPAVGWMIFIFVMSSQSQISQPFGFSVFAMSIIAHLVLYGVLAVLLLHAFDPGGHVPRSARIAAIAGAFLYGMSDEFHQSFVPGRDASLFDIVVNTIGATIAVDIWSRVRPHVPVFRSR